MLVGSAASSVGIPPPPKEAKKDDLVHGATVRCTYAVSRGNGNLPPGGRRRGGFRGGFGGMSQRDLMMLMLLEGRGGFGGGGFGGYSDSDEYGYDSDGSY